MSNCSEYIYDFWNGEKCRDLQEFWDLNATFELPIICDNPYCKRIYRAFSKSSLVESLHDAWNEDEKQYRFICDKC